MVSLDTSLYLFVYDTTSQLINVTVNSFLVNLIKYFTKYAEINILKMF